ncbi:hypothetical protein [Mycobacterium sp. ITM-2016-00318]|uniref:hypothetical protein n=1 Tax=Mycobacterium sp. ITM-2016-00318 TaxID=2099693 RepID=UPI000D40B749|nr:hypothetical protein [Mycobacterium sp. ITM-2016-00318]WNG94998.1 hypothetical protein C6A82_011500 [Mycobacterium sp. ITM-2016-00318]
MAGLFVMLFLLGLLLWLLPWLAVVAALVAAGWLVRRWLERDFQRDMARRREDAELAARADQQNRWFLAGDPRGVFGEQKSIESGRSVKPVRRQSAPAVVRRSVGGVTVKVTVA